MAVIATVGIMGLLYTFPSCKLYESQTWALNYVGPVAKGAPLIKKKL